MNRRQFIQAAGAGIACHLAGKVAAGRAAAPAGAGEATPAMLGGTPVRKAAFPGWPVMDEYEDRALLEVLRSGKWFRGYGKTVDRFEQDYAALTGAKHCIATANGTSALLGSLGALGISPGDEVILSPYTFIATLNVVLLNFALPRFVDSDRQTFQIDAKKVEAAITDRTAAIIPVHIGGSPADLDTILAVGQKRNLPIIEDACQAHLAEWRGKKLGALGTTGCFSFQNSKNLNSGEGGAILTNDADLAQRIFAFHNNCRGRNIAGYDFSYMGLRGANLRMTEFQAALLLAQMRRVEEQSKTREQNAAYLTKMLGEIPGIMPAKMYEGCTRNAYHLYMFRYDSEQFSGLSRAKFMKAMGAEGIPCSGGYSPLNKEKFLLAAIRSKAYQRIYPKELLDSWVERNACPENDRLCQEAVWFTQTMFLGPRSDMDHIVAAVRKIKAHAGGLAKA